MRYLLYLQRNLPWQHLFNVKNFDSHVLIAYVNEVPCGISVHANGLHIPRFKASEPRGRGWQGSLVGGAGLVGSS